MSQFDLLVVDDDERMRAWFLRALQADGCSVRIADTLAEARSLLQANPAQIAFVDFHLPDGTGDELIRWAVAERKIDAAYCMTAYAECGNVVAAMRAGAVDVFEKPVDIEFLRRLLATPRPAADEELSRWRRNYAADIIGNDAAILQLLRVIQRVARTTSTVLIHGESGSGKEQLAASIHRASARASRPFVALNCAAIPETLIESELFGHARGAFTGASLAREGHILSADGGTLFLDEIGDMPLPAQGKLLRVLQERKVTPVGSDRSIPVDVRIVAATHRDLDAMVEAHQFREDLYYRLSVIQMELPPLRERAGDIPAIAQFLVGKIATQMGLDSLSLDDSALRALQEHEWPGNVRELSNAIERALVTATGTNITGRDLALPLKGKRRSSNQSRPILTGNEPRAMASSGGAIPVSTAMPNAGIVAASAAAPAPANVNEGTTTADLNLKSALDQVERQMIEQALSRTGGNRTEAAALLGLNRSTLVEKIRKLNG